MGLENMTSLRILLSNLINIAVGVISFFLISRILLVLFGANQATPFVAFIYDFSAFFMSPFAGIFRTPVIDGATFDVPATFALIVYSIIGYLAISLISTFIVPYYHRRIGEEHV